MAACTKLGCERVCLKVTDATLRTLPVHRLLRASYIGEILAEDATSRGFHVLGQDAAQLRGVAACLDRAIVGVGDSDWKWMLFNQVFMWGKGSKSLRLHALAEWQAANAVITVVRKCMLIFVIGVEREMV